MSGETATHRAHICVNKFSLFCPFFSPFASLSQAFGALSRFSVIIIIEIIPNKVV